MIPLRESKKATTRAFGPSKKRGRVSAHSRIVQFQGRCGCMAATWNSMILLPLISASDGAQDTSLTPVTPCHAATVMHVILTREFDCKT